MNSSKTVRHLARSASDSEAQCLPTDFSAMKSRSNADSTAGRSLSYLPWKPSEAAFFRTSSSTASNAFTAVTAPDSANAYSGATTAHAGSIQFIQVLTATSRGRLECPARLAHDVVAPNPGQRPRISDTS